MGWRYFVNEDGLYSVGIKYENMITDLSQIRL